MNVLTLLRGCPGVGKSTFIERNGLSCYTVCPDEIRLQLSSPRYDVDSEGVMFKKVNNANDKKVFEIVDDMLETRMKQGEFVVLDAKNTNVKSLKKYREMARKYGYRINVVDLMEGVTLKTVLKQNRSRKQTYKILPDSVIISEYEKAVHNTIPSGMNVVKPQDFDKTLMWKSKNLNEYKKILVFGDIHGSYTALEKVIADGKLEKDTFYIFLGDLLDRGTRNADVFRFLYNNRKENNIAVLKGNHDLHLRNHLIGENIKGRAFKEGTLPELYRAGFKNEHMKHVFRMYQTVFAFNYHGQEYFCSHGGVSERQMNPDDKGLYRLMEFSELEFIFGLGNYNVNIDKLFEDEQMVKSPEDRIIQFHGHRNQFEVGINDFRTIYNLENNVDRGGYLRHVEITLNGLTAFETKNDDYNVALVEDITNVDLSQMNPKDVIRVLRNSKYIKEAKLPNGISSFNFTREAFENKEWNSYTISARGLFTDKNGRIIARGYPKFFNLGENEETQLHSVLDKVTYPVRVLDKENGFLGISSVHNDNVILTSKGGSKEFSKYFQNLFYNHMKGISSMLGVPVKVLIERYKKVLTENNISLTFEVIDVENDKHVVIYPKSKIVLLHAIKNDFTNSFENDLCDDISKMFFLEQPKVVFAENEGELRTLIDMSENVENLEGHVFEDSTGYMFKVKGKEYSFNKRIRSQIGWFIRNPDKFTEEYIRSNQRYSEDVEEALVKLIRSGWELPRKKENQSMYDAQNDFIYDIVKILNRKEVLQ